MKPDMSTYFELTHYDFEINKNEGFFLLWLFHYSTSNDVAVLETQYSELAIMLLAHVVSNALTKEKGFMGVIGSLVTAEPGSCDAASVSLVACLTFGARRCLCKISLAARLRRDEGIERSR
jgi:hypothetical protein